MFRNCTTKTVGAGLPVRSKDWVTQPLQKLGFPLCFALPLLEFRRWGFLTRLRQ